MTAIVRVKIVLSPPVGRGTASLSFNGKMGMDWSDMALSQEIAEELAHDVAETCSKAPRAPDFNGWSWSVVSLDGRSIGSGPIAL